MYVRVVLLRCAGVKLARNELEAAQEHRGHLTIGPAWASLYARSDGPITVLPALLEPRVRHLRGDDLIIVGLELVPGGRVDARQPQAWWCRLEAPPAGPEHSPRPDRRP